MPEESNTTTIARPVGDMFAFRAPKGRVRPTGSYDLQARDGGTVVTFHLAATLSGVKRLMAPMVAKTMKSEVAALAELKRVLEEPPGHGWPPSRPWRR